MKVHAFVPAAQPDWVQASVASYYDLVDKIVVSHDADGLGWSGKPMPVTQTLDLLRAIDHAGKMVFSPGKYYRPEHVPHDNATHQRQCALDEAGEGADWVLMFDTDEVLADADVFRSCLQQAHEEGFDGLHFPARWLYQYLGKDRYLEECSRFWSVAASYPGPVAVRPHARLTHHRQCDVSLFRVDFRRRNTDPWHPPTAPVHRVVGEHEGIIHFSYVRDQTFLEQKFSNHGGMHNRDHTRTRDIWAWSGRHPYLAVLRTPFLRRHIDKEAARHLRLTRIAPPNRYVREALGEQVSEPALSRSSNDARATSLRIRDTESPTP